MYIICEWNRTVEVLLFQNKTTFYLLFYVYFREEEKKSIEFIFKLHA